MSTNFATSETAETAATIITPQQHSEAIANIAMNCNEVTFSISWLSQSKQVDAATKEQMISVVNGQKKGFGVSKRLFTSSHPLIDELNAARRNILAWRDSFTIVKAGSTATNDIEGGVRLIRIEDIPEFERGFYYRRDLLYSAADAVTRCLNSTYMDSNGQTWQSILDLERERLGIQFNVKDYPENLRDKIFVSEPSYQAYQPSVRLPSEIYARECRRVAKEIDRTIETATNYVTEEINTAFETLANQLVNRVRVNIHEDDQEFQHLKDAEIVRQTVNGDGSVTICLRYRVDDANSKSGKTTITQNLNFPSEEAFKARLHPLETSERRTITTSSIEHILEKLSQFSRVKTMLGAQGEQMDSVLNNIRRQFSSVGQDAVEIAKEFKSSARSRRQLASALSDAVDNLVEQAAEVKKVRRAVNPEAIKLWEKD